MFLKKEYENNIPEKIRTVLGYCAKAADELSLPIFLIGGIVRDIIIEKKNFDVDVVVIGNAISFAEFLEGRYKDFCKIKSIHEDFKTAKVVFNIDNEEIDIDLASTRKERYPYPSSLPKIEKIECKLKDDVIRRDFTINSMALSLNEQNFCELIDYLGGYEDIKLKKIKILHPKSFIDDPTRIIRALKFSVRFSYELEKETKLLQQKCLDSTQFDNLAGERVKKEIKESFNCNKFGFFRDFIKNDIYKLVNSEKLNLDFDLASIEEVAQKIEKIVKNNEKHLKDNENIWLIYLGYCFKNISEDKFNKIPQNLYFSNEETKIFSDIKKLDKNINVLQTAKTNFEIYEVLENIEIESILAIITTINDKKIVEKINLYLEKLQHITISVTGKDLIEAGLEPGPEFSEVLRGILKAKINEENISEQDCLRGLIR